MQVFRNTVRTVAAAWIARRKGTHLLSLDSPLSLMPIATGGDAYRLQKPLCVALGVLQVPIDSAYSTKPSCTSSAAVGEQG